MQTPSSIFLKTIKLGWKHKILWLLGLGAVVLTTGNEFYLTQTLKLNDFGPEVSNFWTICANIFSALPHQISASFYLILFLALSAITSWIAISAQGAIIKKIGADDSIETAKKNLLLPRRIFWKVTSIVLAVKVILVAISILILSIPGWFKTADNWLNTIIIFLLYLILIVLFVAIVIYERYAVIDNILNPASLKTNLRNAWLLLTRNIFLNLECAIMVVAAILALGIALSLVEYLATVVPWLLLLLFTTLKIPTGILATGMIFYVLIFLIILVFNSWLGAFYHTYWTLVFKTLQHDEPEIESQIIKVIRNR